MSIKTYAILVFLACATFLTSPLRAQDDQEERCTPDGYVQVYTKSISHWSTEYSRHCNGDREASYRGRSRDRDDRSSHSSSTPEDGDEKCGPDGYVMRYWGNLHSWGGTPKKCR